MVHNSLAWPAKKVRQVEEAGRPSSSLVTMYRRIVLGACSTPSFTLSSKAIRSSPHSGMIGRDSTNQADVAAGDSGSTARSHRIVVASSGGTLPGAT